MAPLKTGIIEGAKHGQARERQRGIIESARPLTKEMARKARRFSDYGAFTELASQCGGDVVRAYEIAKADVAGEAKKVSEDLFPTPGNRDAFEKSVRKFCDDSFSLLFAMVLMEGRLDSQFSARIESALAQRGRNLVGFMEDFNDLKSPDRTKERVLSTLETFRDEFPRSLCGQLDKFASEVRKGTHDDTFAQISKIYTETKIGEQKGFESYFFINYRENAFFDIVSLAMLNASIGMIKKNDMVSMFRRESPEQVFLFPTLFVPIYGADDYMRLRAGKVSADIPIDDELRAVLSEQEMWKDVPIRPAEQTIPPLGNISTLIREMPSANVDAVTRAENNTLPPQEMKSFIFRRMAEKKITPVLDVVPSGCSMGDRDGTRANSSARTVHYGINDTFPEMEMGGGISMMFHHLSDRLRFVNNMKNSIGYTDGAGIYLFPYYSRMPTRDLNAYMLFGIARHEFGHIDMGSFDYTAGAVPEIDLFAPLAKNPEYAQRYKEKGEHNIKELQEFLNGVMESVDDELGKKASGKAKLLEVFQAINKTIESHYKKEAHGKNPYIKRFYEHFGGETYRYVENLLDDYRIDRHFYDGKGRDEILYETSAAETDKLRQIYRVSDCMLAMPKAVHMHEEFRKDPQTSNALATLFLMKMLRGRAFDDLIGPSVDPLFRDICETALSKAYTGEKTPKRINETMGATIEFMALAIIFDDAVKPPKVRMQEKGEKGEGGEGQQQGQKGGKSQQGLPKKDLDEKQKPKEGKGDEKEKGKAEKKEEDEGRESVSPIDKDPNADIKITKEEKKASEKGRAVEKMDQREERLYQTIDVPAEKVEMFKQFFRDLRIDRIVINRELGKRGANVDVDELAKFMYKRGAREATFLEKQVTEIDVGSHLEARPIDIYIGVDTSGSMSGQRLEQARRIALEMLAGYSEVAGEMRAANIRLHFIAVATEGDHIAIRDWDATKGLRVERKGDICSISYKFSEIGGGTDLPAMISQFESFVEEIKKETISEIVRGRNALNPSVMLMFMTDFGDNAGDLDGVVEATGKFGAFANQYRADSKTVNYISNDAGIATLFVVPDDHSDNDEIMNAVKGATSGAVVNFIGENERDVLDKLKELRPVLEGLRATNVVGPSKKQ
jgi:hypothetical protein